MSNNIRFKDVALFYIGCKCKIKSTHSGKWRTTPFRAHYLDHLTRTQKEPDYSEIKPILRHLSSMTPDEMRGWVNDPRLIEEACVTRIREISSDIKLLYGFLSLYGNENSFLWLCRHCFDIFGLIDSGEAFMQ